MVPGVREREVGTEVAGQELVFLILRRHTPGIRLPAGHTHDFALQTSRLHILVHSGIRGGHEEGIGPWFVGHPGLHLCQQREVVVMKSPSVGVHELAVLLVPYLHAFHHIVVFGVVHAQCGSHHDAVAEHILPVKVGLVGMEGTYSIRHIEIVGVFAVCHDVDGATQRIGAEPGRHHPFIDFHMVDEAHGQVGQRHAAALCVEGHTVEEVAHGVARHAVDGEVEVGAHAPFLAHFHARGAVDNGIEIVDGVDKAAYVDSIDGERPFAQFLCPRLSYHRHLIERHGIAQVTMPLRHRIGCGAEGCCQH